MNIMIKLSQCVLPCLRCYKACLSQLLSVLTCLGCQNVSVCYLIEASQYFKFAHLCLCVSEYVWGVTVPVFQHVWGVLKCVCQPASQRGFKSERLQIEGKEGKLEEEGGWAIIKMGWDGDWWGLGTEWALIGLRWIIHMYNPCRISARAVPVNAVHV